MSRRSWIALVVPLVLVAAYFGVTSYIRAHVDDLIAAAVDRPLPPFELTDRNGRQWSNEDLAGKRAVLHFFRSYCRSCDLEAPAIRELEQQAGEDVIWLHVMTDVVLDIAPEVTAATIDRKQFEAPVLMADAAFVDAFHKAKWSQVTPITYVVDAEGTVRYALRGQQTVDSVTAAIRAAADR